jgi:hypothetical protein
VSAYLTLRRVARASPVAIAVLIAANAVPLVGVLFLGWDLATLVAVYWAENGVVGVYAVARILTAGRRISLVDGPAAPQPPPPPRDPGRAAAGVLPRLGLTAFFCVHYGIFWLVHGTFVWFVLPMLFSGFIDEPGIGAGFNAGFGSPFGADVVYPDASVVLTAAVILLVSHGVSFVANWLLRGEHLTSTPEAEMAAPYTRVVVLHMTILLGAFGAALFGARRAALVVLVVLKTAVDLAAHLAERRRAAARGARATPRPPIPEGLDAPPA